MIFTVRVHTLYVMHAFGQIHIFWLNKKGHKKIYETGYSSHKTKISVILYFVLFIEGKF